ncbi:Hypothetical protein FKW44_008706 [Caligus rogercresseyi]|uniref:Uncharacterized protein n=1 Tax=Caligus rogercresseyi TaxID=217165 RepID=A0A7T8KGH0_CALRO|nr:Hypothetical protein FKW44_008706 [Caligus rogercresseyi]
MQDRRENAIKKLQQLLYFAIIIRFERPLPGRGKGNAVKYLSLYSKSRKVEQALGRRDTSPPFSYQKGLLLPI